MHQGRFRPDAQCMGMCTTEGLYPKLTCLGALNVPSASWQQCQDVSSHAQSVHGLQQGQMLNISVLKLPGFSCAHCSSFAGYCQAADGCEQKRLGAAVWLLRKGVLPAAPILVGTQHLPCSCLQKMKSPQRPELALVIASVRAAPRHPRAERCQMGTAQVWRLVV